MQIWPSGDTNMYDVVQRLKCLFMFKNMHVTIDTEPKIQSNKRNYHFDRSGQVNGYMHI